MSSQIEEHWLIVFSVNEALPNCPSYGPELFEINLQYKPFRPRIQGVLAKISKRVRMEVGAGTSMSPYDTGTTLVEICPRIVAYQNSYQLPLNQVQ